MQRLLKVWLFNRITEAFFLILVTNIWKKLFLNFNKFELHIKIRELKHG